MRRIALILVFFFVMCDVISILAQDVYVEVSNGQYGHGFLRKHGDICYVVLPKHVISLHGDITVTVSGGVKSYADRYKDDISADLTSLSMRRDICGNAGGTVDNELVINALRRSSNAVLVSLTRDGSTQRRNSWIGTTTSQTLTFTVDNNTSPLQKGDSGSVLRIGEIPVGMLIDVPDNSSTGRAYQQSIIEEFWKHLFPTNADCKDGCSFIATQTNLAKTFSVVSDEHSGFAMNTTFLDYVYRVPEGIPLPTYFHFWRNKYEMQGMPIGSPPTTYTMNFSFSNQLLDRASDITVPTGLFDSLGYTEYSFLIKGRIWDIRISREANNELLITIKRDECLLPGLGDSCQEYNNQ